MQHTSDAALRASLSGPSNVGKRPSAPPPDKPRHGMLMSGNKLILIVGLGLLAWISTYVGMLELIEANMGELPLIMQVAIGGSVAMLMLMIIWLLDQMFDENNAVTLRVVYAAGYLFLALISIGFSFGFYWKFLESRTEASRYAEGAITQVQGSLTAAEARLTQMQQSFEALAAISTQKAQDEVATGRSCPNSRPGDGPRRRLREADAAGLSLASQFVRDRAAAIRKDIAALNDDVQKIAKQDKSTFDPKTGTRNEFMRAMGRKLELTVSSYNSFRTDPQLAQFRADFAERAEKSVFPDDNGKTFACPDVQLQTGLRGAVKSIDALPVMTKPEIITVEGADATIEAFRRLLTTMSALATFRLPPSPDDIRAEQARAIQSLGANAPAAAVVDQAAGLGKRDWVPLLIAVFVDLCLLLVKIPPALSAAERTRRRRANATGEGYRTISDLAAIHADEDTLKQLEPLRHIAFDHWGHDYVAVPMIAGTGAHIPPRRQRDENGWIAYIFGSSDEPVAKPMHPTKEDLWEAQFLANLFASHEHHGPYKRIFGRFVPVRSKLRQIGSKWQDVQSFRLYRFKRGAWSDFVLDVIVGADRALAPLREAQERARIAKVELKRDVILNEAEALQIEHECKIEEQRDIIQTRRKVRELAAKRDTLELEKERHRLEAELARQIASDAEQFGDYVPGEDRDPDGLLMRTTRRSSSAAPASAAAAPEIVALMQSVSQQALATQEIVRQQAAFLEQMGQNMARMVEAIARDRGESAPTMVMPAASGDVHSFAAAHGRRETTLDVARNQREARPAAEAPIVIPLHGDRCEPKLDDSGQGNNGHAAPAANHSWTAAFDGNTALHLKPVAEARAPLPTLGYGLSRLLGRKRSSINTNGHGTAPHLRGGIHFDDRPIEPLVATSVDVTDHDLAGGDARANRDADFLADGDTSTPDQINAFVDTVRQPFEDHDITLSLPSQDEDDDYTIASRFASQRLNRKKKKGSSE